jgi:hypothetical protein
MLESEADRLASIKALGGEPFTTDQAEKLVAIFDNDYQDSSLGNFSVANSEPVLHCRTTDVAAHALVKTSKLVRDSDGSVWFVQQRKDDGVGMTLLEISE